MAAKKSKGKRCLNATWGCLKAIFCLNITNYFLASGIVYVACALVVNWEYGKVQTFLCNVWAEYNATGDFGKGCLNCGFDNIFCGKSECWHDAINLTYKQSMVNATPNIIMQLIARAPEKQESAVFQDATVDVTCNTILQEKTSPVEALVTMATLAKEKSDNPAAETATVTEACQQFHCKTLQNALEHPDLVKGPINEQISGCTDQMVVKRSWARDKCICAGLYQTLDADDIELIQNYCQYTLKTTSTTTTTTTTSTSTTTITVNPSSGRRLDRLREAGQRNPSLLPQENANCGQSSMADWRFADKQTADRVQSEARDVDSLVGMADDLLDSVPMRALQDAPAPQPAGGLTNDDFEEYETGDWSKCKCYQQCVSGVMTRSVKCLADRCKEPKPATLMSCTCPHCAECSILLNLTIFYYLFQIQGGVALFVWFNFLWLARLQEANFVKTAVSYPRWFLGIWVKLLPSTVRLCVLMNIVQVLVVLIQTWTPKSIVVITPDCNASRDLRVLSLILLGVMIFQITLGILTRITNRMPPFLHRPERPVHFLPLRFLGWTMRSLGP